MAQFTVLGASGFIGGTLAARLAEAGHDVYRPSRSELGRLDRRALGHVFYSLGVEHACNDPFGAFEAHVEHLARVLQSCEFSSLTYLSSTRLYLEAPAARETETLRLVPDDPNAIFNATKIIGEQLCIAAKKTAIRVVRLSNVVGFAPNGTSLIPGLVKDAITRGRLSLTISPLSSKDYIAVDDVCDLLPRIALEGQQSCYNVASGFNIELAEIVGLVDREFPTACEWRAGAPTVIFPIVDIDRIRTEFAFQPRPVREALRFTLAQYRRHLAVPAGANLTQA